MKHDLYFWNLLIFISLENTKRCKKFFSSSLLLFTDLLISFSNKGAIYDGGISGTHGDFMSEGTL